MLGRIKLEIQIVDSSNHTKINQFISVYPNAGRYHGVSGVRSDLAIFQPCNHCETVH